jgi:hypothetical protein
MIDVEDGVRMIAIEPRNHGVAEAGAAMSAMERRSESEVIHPRVGGSEPEAILLRAGGES